MAMTKVQFAVWIGILLGIVGFVAEIFFLLL